MTIIGRHARAGALIALVGAAAPGCGSLLGDTVKGQLESVSETMELCRDILPEPGNESAGGKSDVGGALLDQDHLERRLRAYLGDVQSLTDEPMDKAFDTHQERLDALAKQDGPAGAAAVDLLRAAKDFGATLGEIARRAQQMAQLLASGAPGGGSSHDKLAKIIFENAQNARELKKAVMLLMDRYQTLETSATRLREALERRGDVGPDRQHLQRLLGRARAHYQWMVASLPILDSLAAGQPRRLFGALAVREIGGLSRLALNAVQAAIRNLDRQLQRVDEQAYGALTLFSIATAPDVDPIIEAAFCQASQQIAGVLRRMSVEPRALAVEACASLASTGAREDELLLSGKYHSFLRGLVKGAAPEPCGGKAAPSSPPSPAPPDDWAHFQRSATYASVTSEWTSRLAYEIAHGDGPPQPTSLATARLAHAEALLRAPLAPDDLTVAGGGPRDEALSLAIADLAVHVRARHEIVVTGLDAAAFDRAVQRLIDDNLQQRDLQSELLRTLRRREDLYDQGRQVMTLCGVISQDRTLQRKGTVEVRCSDRRGAELQYNVVTIELDARCASEEWAVFESGDRRRQAQRARAEITGTDTAANATRRGLVETEKRLEKLEVIENALRKMAQHMHEIAGRARLRVLVSGSASESAFPCPRLAQQLEKRGEIEKCNGNDSAMPCYVLEGGADNPTRLELRIDSDRVASCKGKDGDANPLLSGLRAWSAYKVIQGPLKGSALSVDMPKEIFNTGEGKATMQRIGILLFPQE